LINSGANFFSNSFCKIPLISSTLVSALPLVENPTPVPKSLTVLVPTFDVINITQFLKLTFLPCESVTWPSSNICKNKLNTSGCAFSISSKRITE